ncbi:MAG: hypothetical protein K6E58_00295 [Eubacterium sp.]|nr:hypothetical protein [Eubacterium sp.]
MRKPIINIKNPRVKSILITILEILVVAGIIFGVLMFIYSKVNKEADKKSGIAKQQESTVSKQSKKYFLAVSKKLNTVVVYKYTDNLNSKKLEKAFKASVGDKVKPGTFKTKSTYTWMKTNGAWHQYNTTYAKEGYVQSIAYNDKYPNTMKRNSYQSLGFEKHKDNCIWLTCKDADWVRKNTYRITIQVVDDKAQFVVPKTNLAKPNLVNECGWDPTDPNKNNPYKKQKNNTITFGLDTVVVEKGHKLNYLDNIIAKDAKGVVITQNLKYKKINTSKLKTYKVQYKFKNLSGVQKIIVVDTTPPKVTIANKKFEFELKSLDKKDVIKQKNIDKIKDMVRAAASCNEPNCIMTVQTIDKEDLNEGDVSVVVKAKDASGNIGGAQAFVKVKVKEEKIKKLKFPKKKKHKKKKVVKKKHKKKKKQVETETVINE